MPTPSTGSLHLKKGTQPLRGRVVNASKPSFESDFPCAISQPAEPQAFLTLCGPFTFGEKICWHADIYYFTYNGGMKQSLYPVDLMIPSYRERSPEDLFGREMETSGRLLSAIRFLASRRLSPQIIIGQGDHDSLFDKAAVHVFAHHQNYIDPVIAAMVLEAVSPSLDYNFVALAELFGVRHGEKRRSARAAKWCVARAMAAAGAIPLDRYLVANGKLGELRKLSEMVHYAIGNMGHSIIIFAEGGFGDDPTTVTSVSSGAISLARSARVPLAIWALAGNEQINAGLALPTREPAEPVAYLETVVAPDQRIKQADLLELSKAAYRHASQVLAAQSA